MTVDDLLSILTDKQKQDCETNAFKRMIKRIKNN